MLRRVIGQVIWYFVADRVEQLACACNRDLIDEDDLQSELRDVRHDIRLVDRRVDELEGEV
jgi:hypothetical protein